jgi:hypothetical protein
MSLPSFLRPVPMFPAPLFAPRGPVRLVPPLHRSYCGAPTSRRPDPARSSSRGRSRLVDRKATRSPRFLGSPCVRAELYDPGGASVPRSTVRPPCTEVMPSALNTASASTTQVFRGSITRPTHPLSTLRSHGRPCVSYGHARLALDQATQPGRTGFSPVGYSLKFWALPLLSSQACPGARSTPSEETIFKTFKRSRQRGRTIEAP